MVVIQLVIVVVVLFKQVDEVSEIDRLKFRHGTYQVPVEVPLEPLQRGSLANSLK